MSKNDLYETAVIKLFQAVGFDFTFEQCLAWSKKHTKSWYNKKTWTEEQQREFYAWLVDLVKKANRTYPIQRCRTQAGYFLLDHGWKVADVNKG